MAPEIIVRRIVREPKPREGQHREQECPAERPVGTPGPGLRGGRCRFVRHAVANISSAPGPAEPGVCLSAWSLLTKQACITRSALSQAPNRSAADIASPCHRTGGDRMGQVAVCSCGCGALQIRHRQLAAAREAGLLTAPAASCDRRRRPLRDHPKRAHSRPSTPGSGRCVSFREAACGDRSRNRLRRRCRERAGGSRA